MGRESLEVQGIFGSFKLSRDYYYHAGKKEGHYPAGAALGLEVAYTPALARLMCLEGADETSYQKAQNHLEQTGGIEVCVRQIQRVVQRVGVAAQGWQQREAQPGGNTVPIQKSRPLTEDPALLEPLELQMQRLVAQLCTVQQTVDQYDQHIRQVFAAHSLAWLFAPLPGAGPVLAPRLAAVFGTIQSNFQTALDLLCFSGVAPVRKQSGNLEEVHFRYARPIFLHQSIVEFAKCSLGQCAWARLLYDAELKNKKSKWMAIRKVTFKWIRILWRCWQTGQPYDETQYLRSLQRDGVELYRSLYEALPPLQTAAVNNS